MPIGPSSLRPFACSVLLLISFLGLRPGASVTGAEAEDGEISQSTEVTPGHSAHGEAFNEGPRQKAYLMPGTGKIHFPVTTSHPQVQKFIEQGIGQLHGYWTLEAERSFRHAATLDPECAIAYWGMAMANAGDKERAKAFLDEARSRRGLATEREAMYIDALDDFINGGGKKSEKAKRYLAAYEAIVARYPDDLEAKAFRGYILYKYRGDLKKKHEEVDAALAEVLAIEPLHPVHHYRIHLWDHKEPEKALAASALCGQAAPAIAHMWHMPGHIYSRLRRYQDAVWQQEASARVDHAHMMRDRVLPDRIHNFAHNNEWLIRNLIYIGRWRDALDLAKNMIELPRHPKYNTLSRGSTAYGRRRLFDVLSKYQLWEETVQLAAGPYLEPTDRESEQLKRLRHLGVAHVELGHYYRAQQVLSELQERLWKAEAEVEKEVAKLPEKKQKEKRRERLAPIQKTIDAITARLAIAEGDYAAALPLLNKAGEDKLTIARVQCLAGQRDQGLKTADDYLKGQNNRVQPLAEYIELLWNAGEKDKAAEAFERLRAISGSIQFGVPILDRLAPIARELGLPEDWRVKDDPSNDVGERSDLEALGPFRWSPMSAPSWTLPDYEGHSHSLADYRGRPVIVIFYLGYGCLHCAEQLHKFAPMTEKFREAGISLVAISSDDREGLKVSLDSYEKKMPIPLLANEKLDVFKAYRVYDDFESTPLHGTFLIDGEGLVRWQDISFEPFMEAEFLLDEAQRLLAQEGNSSSSKNDPRHAMPSPPIPSLTGGGSG